MVCTYVQLYILWDLKVDFNVDFKNDFKKSLSAGCLSEVRQIHEMHLWVSVRTDPAPMLSIVCCLNPESQSLLNVRGHRVLYYHSPE